MPHHLVLTHVREDTAVAVKTNPVSRLVQILLTSAILLAASGLGAGPALAKEGGCDNGYRVRGARRPACTLRARWSRLH